MIIDEEGLLIVAQNVYVGVSGFTRRVLLFLPVSSQGYQGSFQDGEGELLPDIVIVSAYVQFSFSLIFSASIA